MQRAQIYLNDAIEQALRSIVFEDSRSAAAMNGPSSTLMAQVISHMAR